MSASIEFFTMSGFESSTGAYLLFDILALDNCLPKKLIQQFKFYTDILPREFSRMASPLEDFK